jgi:hypothetical protein
MKLFLIPVLSCFCICACQSDTGDNSSREPVLADTAKFYPLGQFFRSQIEYVDLRAFPVYRTSTIDGKKDSSLMSREEFFTWADVYIQRSFADPGLKAAYKEDMFEDNSTDSYTLTYSPHDPSAVEVQNIDILLGHEIKEVKRVFIKSLYTRGDTTIEEQCSWKTNKSFQVNRVKYTRDGYRSTELNYINWNDR